MNRRQIRLALLLLIAVGAAASAQTNTPESLKTRFEACKTEIEGTCRKQKADALARYGSNLVSAAAQLQQKGDLDGYLAAQKEMKRFEQQKTVPTNATSALVAELADAYAASVKKAQADTEDENDCRNNLSV